MAGATTFDPDLHPRDPHGEFTKILSGLKVGHEAHLPDGIRVQATKTKSGNGKTQRKFRVHIPSSDRNDAISNLIAGHSIVSKTHSNAASAAQDALDRSASSTHPASVGGRKRYKGLEDFQRRQQVRAA